MSFWNKKNVLVTGGTGFLGKFVVEKIQKLQANVTVLDRKNGDCTNLTDAKKMCKGQDIIINLAAKVAGIEYNRTHQAIMFRENVQIAMTMLEAARLCHVDRFLTVSSACVYPRDAIIPTPESEGARGDPEPTNGGYGWGKRMAEITSKLYVQEYGMKVGIVRPYNTYGPGDHFDDPASHVIPSLISRLYKRENPFTIWGSGRQTRSFLYAEDLAQGLLTAIEKYPAPDPINLGSDEEVSIKELVDMIMEISGLHPKIVFDTSKPDGSPKRKSDNTKAKKILGFEAKTTLFEGLKKTIRWYENTQHS